MKGETNEAVGSSNTGHRGFPEELGWVGVTVSDGDEAEEIDTQAVKPESALPQSTASSNIEVQTGRTIVDDVVGFVRRFVFLPEDPQYLLVAVWIIATHLQKAVEFFGYLFAYSPEPQSGKTTLLDVLDVLVCNSSGVQNSPTEAVMFRTAQGNTHLLDEVDSWKDKDDLKGVLNAGYKRGGFVTRCDKSRGSFKATKFAVFAPRALAGIGLSILPQSTLDRTFAISMVRQKKTEKREGFRLRVIRQEAAALKRKIEKWARNHDDSFGELYGQGHFPYLDRFSDRTIDIAEPLAAIVELVYGCDSRLHQVRETLLQAIASTRKEQSAPLAEHRILKRLQELANADGTLIGNASELAKLFGNSEEPIDEYAISQALRKYGFKTRSIRKQGENPLKRYELTKAALKEVVDRWVPESDSEPVAPEEPGPEEAIQAREM